MGRKHGLQAPLDPFQVGSFIFFAFLAAGVYAFYVPMVEDQGAMIALIVVYSLLVLLVLGLNLATSLNDPSDPGLYASTTAGEFYCALCQAGVGANSKHCRSCDRCVDGFDHHCKWLNNCIGESNYRSFFLLVATTVTLLIVQLGWGLYLVARSFYAATEMQALIEDRYWNLNYRGWQVCLFIYILMLLAAILMLGELFSFHVVLVMRGMTTYEYIQSSKESAGAVAGTGSGGARAALCRSTKVADEAITRRKSKGANVSLNPCKAMCAEKMEGDLRTWGAPAVASVIAGTKGPSGIPTGKHLEIPSFHPAGPSSQQPISEHYMDGTAVRGQYNQGPYNQYSTAPALRSRSPRVPAETNMMYPLPSPGADGGGVGQGGPLRLEPSAMAQNSRRSPIRGPGGTPPWGGGASPSAGPMSSAATSPWGGGASPMAGGASPYKASGPNGMGVPSSQATLASLGGRAPGSGRASNDGAGSLASPGLPPLSPPAGSVSQPSPAASSGRHLGGGSRGSRGSPVPGGPVPVHSSNYGGQLQGGRPSNTGEISGRRSLTGTDGTAGGLQRSNSSGKHRLAPLSHPAVQSAE